jgi:N-acetylglucosamine-6-phosphate deacetylase
LTDYCLTPVKKIERCGILCENEKILAVGGASAFSRDAELEILEIKNAYVTPGFIDTHIHGAGGFDSSTADEQGSSINSMSKTLAEHGVTSFVCTVVSAPVDRMLYNLSILADMMKWDLEGADAAGISLEGPFLNRSKCGSQIQNDIRDVDLGLARELIAAGKGQIKKMTFAPELNDSIRLIELLKENRILPSMGHSNADEQATLNAIDAGATCCTHLFNGMPPLHQRDIALTAVALTDERVSIELILDGMHLHPRIIDLACRCKLSDKVIGISDSTQAAGLKDGKYHIGNSEIYVKDGISRTNTGLLAGTTTLLDTGWHSLMTFSDMEETKAAACVTLNPANSLRLNDRGLLQPGKLADLAFFEKNTNRPLLTVRRGKIVYDADNLFKPVENHEEEPNS